MPNLDKKTQDFFAQRIQTWYRRQKDRWYQTHTKPKSFYVLKERCGRAPLSKEQIVKEHIASVLYRLMGIKTPEIRIVKYRDQPEKLGIVSQYIKGYRDLYKILNISSDYDAEELIERLDRAPDQTERNELFKKHIKEISLGEREALLVASVCLMDPDVIGVKFTNIGYTWNKKQKKQEIVKIDTGQLDFSVDKKEFEEKVSLDNKILYSDFTSRVYNDPTIQLVGNLHLLEFFNDIDKHLLTNRIKQLASISDDEIRRHVIREAYQSLVEPVFLEKIAQAIIDRKAHLLSLISLSDEEIVQKKLSLQPIFINRNAFSEPVHIIPRGNATPAIVYKKEDTDISSDLSNSRSWQFSI